MDLELGFITPGLTERSILSQSGGSETLQEMALEDFPVNMINDFSQETLKAEKAHYDDKKVIPVKNVCSSFHGGPLDYPKACSKAIGDILSKWQVCFEKSQLELELDRRKPAEDGEEDSANLDVKHSKAENSDDDVYEKLTGNAAPKGGAGIFGAAGAKKPPHGTRYGTMAEEEFHSSVSESVSKVVVHSTALIKSMLVDGDMPGLLAILGGLAFARNKIWFYNETIIAARTKVRPFTDSYKELSELVEATSEQLVDYQMSLIATTILHDAPSQNWTSQKPFYEGERISHCVQMWWYYLQGFQADLWNSLPPKIASNMFAKIFDHTYGILVGRYAKVTPSTKRIVQFRGDITTLLLITSEALTYIAGSTYQLLGAGKPTPFGGQLIWSIHTKSRLLFDVLAIVASPLGSLYKTALDTMKPKLKSNLPPLEHHENVAVWMHLIRPGIFHSPNPDAMCAESHIVLLAKLAANQPYPAWSLIVQLLLCHDLRMSKIILLHFGAFVPGIQQPAKPSADETDEGDGSDPSSDSHMTDGCKGYDCRKRCVGSADVSWPQSVGSGILKVALHGGVGGKNSLSAALGDLFNRMSGTSWDAVSRSQLWNTKRPVWLQAIIHLVEPHVIPAVVELLDLLDSGRTWTLTHVPQAMKEVMTSLVELVTVVPSPVLRVCINDIQNRLPSGVEPLSNSVIVHVMVSAVYGVVCKLQSVLKREKISKEKLDFVIAFGEALINLDTSADLTELNNAAKEALIEADEFEGDAEPGSERNFDMITNEYSHFLAEEVAGEILSDEAGKFALKALHRFVCYNVDWIQCCMGVSQTVGGSSDVTIPALIKPWGSEIYPPVSPYDMMNQIGASAPPADTNGGSTGALAMGASDPVVAGYNKSSGDFRISRILEVHHPWEHYLRYVFSQTSSNKLLYEQLIGRRTEFLSMAPDGSFLETDDIYTGLAADEKLMLETTLQLIREGGPTTQPTT